MEEFVFSGGYSKQFVRAALVILLNACTIVAHAQISFLKKIDTIVKKVDEIGLTVGPGMVWFQNGGIYQDGRDAQAIQNFGLDIQWLARNPRLKLDTKILFERLGNRTSSGAHLYANDSTIYGSLSRETTFALNYLTIPVSVYYHFFKNRRLYTAVGIFGGYFIKGKLTIEESDGIIHKIYNYYDFSKDFKEYNFGGTAGIGYRLLQKENFHLAIELTGRFGFLDLNNHNLNKPDPVRTQALALTVLLSTSVNRNKLN